MMQISLRHPVVLALPFLIAACGSSATDGGTNATVANAAGIGADAVASGATPRPAASPSAPVVTSWSWDRYLGTWTGVEGTMLEVSQRPAGKLQLQMQYDLDHKGTFEGEVQPDGIHFTRNGEQLVARPSNGDATGLKWLAGKKDCLTVSPGEGYCRD